MKSDSGLKWDMLYIPVMTALFWPLTFFIFFSFWFIFRHTILELSIVWDNLGMMQEDLDKSPCGLTIAIWPVIIQHYWIQEMVTISKVMIEDEEKCSENLQPSINKHSREVLLENDALFSNFRSTTKMKNFTVSSICPLWHLSNLSLNCIWALVQITLMWSLSALPLPLKLDFFENSSSLDSRDDFLLILTKGYDQKGGKKQDRTI